MAAPRTVTVIMGPTATSTAVTVSRNGNRWQFVLHDFDPEIRQTLKAGIPFLTYDPQTKAWSAPLTAQSLDTLRSMRWHGLLHPDPDTLVAPGEELPVSRPAMLRPGSTGRPYVVHMATRNDDTYRILNAVPGANWSKDIGGFTYPPAAVLRLAGLVESGVLDDPQRLLDTGQTVQVFYDSATGQFVIRGDSRAAAAFADKFPERDVMSIWRDRGLDVDFADPFTAEMYRGELTRHSEGLQPDGLLVKLHDFQRRDVEFVVERTGSAVFGSMGVGKTAIAIAAAHERLNNRGTVKRVVMVVPPSLRTQWHDEIVRFTGADPSEIVVIDGDKKTREKLWEKAKTCRWLIVHYNAATLADGRLHLPRLVSGAFLIADEVHRVKDHSTATHKQMKILARRSACRVGLSGTPVENKPGEWFNVISGFIVPGVFGSPTDFLNQYSYPGEFGGFEGARNLPELSRRSRPLYVRHTLDEVAKYLPKMSVSTVSLEPEPAYRNVLAEIHRSARTEIANARLAQMADKANGTIEDVLDGQRRDQIASEASMTATGMLKAVCCSPSLLHRSDSAAAAALVDSGIVPDVDGPKVDWVLDTAETLQADGDRVVVFASLKRMVDLLAERFRERGIRFVEFTGDTKRAARDEAVAAFTTPATDDNPGPTVFLATDAAAEGLNLGRCCSMLVNVDIPWTPGRLGQRNGRIRRLDSTASGFFVINVVIAGTIEAAFLKLVETKADLADAIFGESGGRARTTGRQGRNMFLDAWDLVDLGQTKSKRATKGSKATQAAAAAAEPDAA